VAAQLCDQRAVGDIPDGQLATPPDRQAIARERHSLVSSHLKSRAVTALVHVPRLDLAVLAPRDQVPLAYGATRHTTLVALEILDLFPLLEAPDLEPSVGSPGVREQCRRHVDAYDPSLVGSQFLLFMKGLVGAPPHAQGAVRRPRHQGFLAGHAHRTAHGRPVSFEAAQPFLPGIAAPIASADGEVAPDDTPRDEGLIELEDA
jgi:hypothetical protein